MTSFTIFFNWIEKFQTMDWIALSLFIIGIGGYRFFLSHMLKSRPHNLFLGKLQDYREAWLEAHACGKDNMVVVQTMRNTIMCGSFLASTSILLMMAAFNMLITLQSKAQEIYTHASFMFESSDPGVELFKILLIVIILSYSFFNFTWHLREINYISMVINIPKERLDSIEGKDSIPHMNKLFQKAGIYFSMGMRGYYFLVPLLMWFFSPLMMIVSHCLILYIMIHRDLGNF
ncbi:MAG: DUF599 domain-containing protein [Pseudomonadota bacterium]